MVNKLAFINGKGGCGKTTGVIHVAGVLAQKGEKVLVIDFDKQRNTTTTLLAHNPNRPNKTVLDFLKGEAEASEVTAQALWQSRGNANPKHYGVDCMVSDVDLQDEAALAEIDGEAAGERLETFIREQGYTWVLVDMPPSNLTLNNICFRYIVDYTIVPLSSDSYAVDGYNDIMNIMAKAREDNPGLNVLGVYLSMYDARNGREQYICDILRKLDKFIDVQIPRASDIPEAVMFGRPISYYKKTSKGRKAYEDLVAEMENLMNKR